MKRVGYRSRFDVFSASFDHACDRAIARFAPASSTNTSRCGPAVYRRADRYQTRCASTPTMRVPIAPRHLRHILSFPLDAPVNSGFWIGVIEYEATIPLPSVSFNVSNSGVFFERDFSLRPVPDFKIICGRVTRVRSNEIRHRDIRRKSSLLR